MDFVYQRVQALNRMSGQFHRHLAFADYPSKFVKVQDMVVSRRFRRYHSQLPFHYSPSGLLKLTSLALQRHGSSR